MPMSTEALHQTRLTEDLFGPIDNSIITSKGIICLTADCTIPNLSKMQADPGFASILAAEKVVTMLCDVVRCGGDVSVARTAGGLIASFIAIQPIEPIEWQNMKFRRRWQRLPIIYELGSFEVSRNWRGLGLFKALTTYAFNRPKWDDKILISNEYVWHWDVEGVHLTPREYGIMLTRLLSPHGFVEYYTDESDIACDPANRFMARIGSAVSAEQRHQFERLLVTGEDF